MNSKMSLCGIVLCVVALSGIARGDIWVLGPSQKVARTEKAPAASEIFDPANKTVTLYAAKNEYVAFQVAYSGDMKNVNMDSIEVKGASPITDIQMFHEHYLTCPVVSQWDGRTKPFDVVKLNDEYTAKSAPREFPEQMVPLKATKFGAPFDVAAGANEVIWVDIFVPEDSTAGDYTGTFKTAGQTFNIKLHVWNFALPSISHFPQWAQTHPENIAWGLGVSEKKLSTVQSAYDDFYLMAHNHRLVMMEEWEDKPQVTRNKFDTYVSGEGFTGPFGKGFGFEVIPVQGDAVVKLLDEGKYYNRAFGMTVDEPHGLAAFDKIRQMGADFKDKYHNDLRRFVTTAHDVPAGMGSLDDAVDIYCSPSTPPSEIPDLEKKGKIVWTYNDGYAGSPYIDAPGAASRTQAWAGFVTGSRVWYFWQACYWVDWQQNKSIRTALRGADDPSKLLSDVWTEPVSFDETRKKGYPAKNALRLNGDGVLVYSGKDVGIQGPIAGFRMENIRQGGTDFEYLYLLEKMGKKDVALAEAIKLLGAAVAFKNVTDVSSGTPKFANYDLNGADWDAARIRLGKVLDEIGDKALRAKIVPYNQYPNPSGSPEYYGGARY